MSSYSSVERSDLHLGGLQVKTGQMLRETVYRMVPPLTLVLTGTKSLFVDLRFRSDESRLIDSCIQQ